MGYYSVTRKGEILPFAATWTDFENIIPCFESSILVPQYFFIVVTIINFTIYIMANYQFIAKIQKLFPSMYIRYRDTTKTI